MIYDNNILLSSWFRGSNFWEGLSLAVLIWESPGLGVHSSGDSMQCAFIWRPFRWPHHTANSWHRCMIFFQHVSRLIWQLLPSECPKWTKQKLNGLVYYGLGNHMSLLPASSTSNKKPLMSAQIQGKIEIVPTSWRKKCWWIADVSKNLHIFTPVIYEEISNSFCDVKSQCYYFYIFSTDYSH